MNNLHVTALRLLSCLAVVFSCQLFATGRSNAHDDVTARLMDRAAVERVYHNNRVGVNVPFEQVLPAALLEHLVKRDLQKEAVLQKVYQIAITQDLVQAEVRRINKTTRAPKILAELKRALGNDTNRFARAVARPIVVERLLRNRFDNDDALHVTERRRVENLRIKLLEEKKSGASAEQLLAAMQQSEPSFVEERTWQFSIPEDSEQRRLFYFDRLPPELRRVLHAQLRAPGDVSAVIESSEGFQLYLLKERNIESLSAAVLSIPKRSYEQWLAEKGNE